MLNQFCMWKHPTEQRDPANMHPSERRMQKRICEHCNDHQATHTTVDGTIHRVACTTCAELWASANGLVIKQTPKPETEPTNPRKRRSNNRKAAEK